MVMRNGERWRGVIAMLGLAAAPEIDMAVPTWMPPISFCCSGLELRG